MNRLVRDRDWVLPGAALLAITLLPWSVLPDDFSWFKSYFGIFVSLPTGNAWVQGKWVALVSFVACIALSWSKQRQLRGRGMSIVSAVALLFTLLTSSQVALGWGGSIAAAALLLILGLGLARSGYFKGDVFIASSVVFTGALLTVFILVPIFKIGLRAFFSDSGQFSVNDLATRLFTDRIWGLGCLGSGPRCGVAWNTVFLGLLTATGTTVLGTMLALLAARSFKRGQRVLRLLSLTPIITPPFVVGLGLILLFGRAGLVNQALEQLFGIEPTRWFYGLPGLWLAQLFAFTPVAFLIMQSVVQGISPSLEEAAQTLRADPWHAFKSVTLPLMKPGLTNAFLVGFIESMADFGNPIVVGGSYAVLSTEIFFSIVGAQLDQGKAASLAFLLALFALAVFAIQRWVLGKANYTTVAGKGDSGLASQLPKRLETVMRLIAYGWLSFTALVYLFAFSGGFVANWGRDFSPTLKHMKSAFDIQWSEFGIVWAGSAWNSFWTTVKLAAIAAPITAVLGMLLSFLIARTQFRGKDTFEFASLLAFAVPGTVLGVSYVLAFNVPPLELTGTAVIIVLCFVFRNLPVGVRAGGAAFKQLDKNLDEASSMLGASTFTTLRRVIFPLLKPAFIASLIYSFVRAMTTVSAVIFLVTAEYELATTYIIGRVGNGDYGIALAYCTVLIVMMLLAIGVIQLLVGDRNLGRRHEPSRH
jgi:iron(III) transport system permease protein